MKRSVFLVGTVLSALLGIQLVFVRFGEPQSAGNAHNDFGAVNHGDFIAMQWDDAEGAAQYWMYTSTSLLGPWHVLGSLADNRGGAKVHYTPDARRVTLCYKVEATDQNGVLIRIYDPICVPPFTG